MTSSGAQVELVSISKSFKSSGTAVASVDLNIGAGEFVTLLGPSGSGKTTTLNMIAGFIDPDEGSVRLDGVDVVSTPVHKRDIGMVFQQFSLFPHMTVGENIAFPLKERGMKRAQVAEAVESVLEKVNLAGYANRKPQELSGGQQQRVAIARAIVFGPRLLLMDEPLSALDKKLREHLQLEIKRIQRDLGVTCVFVTHDQEEALLLSDRIVVFNEGEVVQVGTPAEVYAHPSERFVAEFLGDSNLFDGTLGTDDDGARTLGCDEGVFPVATVHADGAACLLLRPEVIELSPSRMAGVRPQIRCVVEDSDYFGPVTKYWVRSETGRMLHVRQTQDPESFLPVGAEVFLSWDPARGHILAGQ